MRKRIAAVILCAIVATAPTWARARQTAAVQGSDPAPVRQPAIDGKTAFKIKFLAEDMVYIDAGRSAGLKPGMKLIVKRAEDPTQPAYAGKTISELLVESIAESSSVCSITVAPTEFLVRGDSAFLSDADVEALVQQRSLSGMRSYPQTITFTDGDPMEEEYREAVPRPRLPEVNRFQGRIGTDFSGIQSHTGLGSTNTQIGLVLNANITRLFGSYWNVNGYWRGRLSQSSPGGQQSIQDLINRTYHLGMTYENPNSRWVAGFGRLYLPWANSLDTIDGGYVGRRLSKIVTAGVFAGSTPDPTSWSYNPDRRIAGSFLNFTAGRYDAVHFSSTSGLALNTIQWRSDRPFIFFENSLSYKQTLTLYSSQMADNPRSITGTGRIGAGLSKSFVSLRFSPARRFTFDVNHNYFRDVPTFDVRLIGTGLLDQYLFQGFSGGVRVETWRRVTVYANLGRSSASGDAKSSLNEMYGISSGPIWKTGLRADIRYSRYESSFGRGNYRALLLSRNLGDEMRIEAQLGVQSLQSQLTTDNGNKFVNILTDMNLGRRFFVQGGYSAQRGTVTNYDQWSTTLGYRFDNRATRRDGR